MQHRVLVVGLPRWCEPLRLLGPGEWTFESGTAHAHLTTFAAADLEARLRGIGVGGQALTVSCEPALSRSAVRAARTTDARRRRDTTPGFLRAGTHLDEEGKYSLTPEALALAIAQRAAGKTVVDAGCGAGGNSIGFARAGCKVTAIETDSARLANARHNARIYAVESKIEFVQGPIETMLPRLRADICFIDPPWGKEWSRTRTTKADFPMIEYIEKTKLNFAEFWAKVPPSFEVRSLSNEARAEAIYGTAAGDARRIKFLILRWKSATVGEE